MPAKVLILFISLVLLASASYEDRIPKFYRIKARGIIAEFTDYGGAIASLWVPNREGKLIDVVLGYDKAEKYFNDDPHPYYGAIVGRYANRIRNGTFVIDGKRYFVSKNDNGGKDTLHGGDIGYDRRFWDVKSQNTTCIAFQHLDKAGFMGFPGAVLNDVTYCVEDGGIWNIRMESKSLEVKTPIMLSSHAYWNLDSFSNPKTSTIRDHTLHLPRSNKRIAVDSILIPTGALSLNQRINNFTIPKKIGKDLDQAVGNCGLGCTGYDNCFIVDQGKGPVASAWSDYSGVRLDIFSNQRAFQFYSCNSMNGMIPLKPSQMNYRRKTVPKYGCMVFEVEGWIDGINHPEWGIPSQIFDKGEVSLLTARYVFSVTK